MVENTGNAWLLHKPFIHRLLQRHPQYYVGRLISYVWEWKLYGMIPAKTVFTTGLYLWQRLKR